MADAFATMKAEFPSAVVEWRNGTYACDALRSQRIDMAVIDAGQGAVSPDVFNVRVNVAECGPVKSGDTVYVNDAQCTVEDIQPDSIGLTLLVGLRVKRLT
jgi:hypothetical protein